jgi:hypothetical protein
MLLKIGELRDESSDALQIGQREGRQAGPAAHKRKPSAPPIPRRESILLMIAGEAIASPQATGRALLKKRIEC